MENHNIFYLGLMSYLVFIWIVTLFNPYILILFMITILLWFFYYPLILFIHSIKCFYYLMFPHKNEFHWSYEVNLELMDFLGREKYLSKLYKNRQDAHEKGN